MQRHARCLVTSRITAHSAALRLKRQASTVAAGGDHQSHASPEIRRNAAGVQLLSRSLHEQVFGVQDIPPLNEEAIDIALQHLKRHGLAEKENPVLPSTNFILPKLRGKDIEDHFYNIGHAHADPYLQYARRLSQADLPQQPESWAEVAGWVCYEPDGSYYPVTHPPDEAMVFDVESLYKLNPYAVMAVAASEHHWYSWTSPWLIGDTEDVEQLIPMPGETSRLVIGHNVGYDRARIEEEYNLQRNQNRFLDTMALHVAVTGLSSHQRAPWMKHKKEKREKMAEAIASASDISDSGDPTWQDLSSMNSLADVAKLHCKINVDKSARNWFEAEDRSVIMERFQDLMGYCANDVLVTHKVFSAVLPAFLRACPNPVTFAGVLDMGSSFLPVDGSWETFLERAEGLYQSYTSRVEAELHKLADEARKLLFVEDEAGKPLYESNPWLRQLDWTPKKARAQPSAAQDDTDIYPAEVDITTSASAANLASATLSSAANAAQGQQTETRAAIPTSVRSYSTSSPSLDTADPVPAWFALFYSPHADGITSKGWDQFAPLLLKLSCNGQPLQYHLEHGWYYRLPDEKESELHGKEVVHKHPSDAGPNCFRPKKAVTRTMLNTLFLSAIEKGAISSPYDLAMTATRLGVSSSSKGKNTSEEYVKLEKAVLQLAREALTVSADVRSKDPWLCQLDWSIPQSASTASISAAPDATASMPVKRQANVDAAGTSQLRLPGKEATSTRAASSKPNKVAEQASKPNSEASEAHAVSKPPSTRSHAETAWPKWYWDLHKPGGRLTIRSKLAPLLLQLRWKGHAIYHSRQHGWLYAMTLAEVEQDRSQRQQEAEERKAALKDSNGGEEEASPASGRGNKRDDADAESGPVPVKFTMASDGALAEDTEHLFFKLPHKDGAKANVGSPLSKTFLPAFENKTLSSEHDAAAAALDMNAQCSYWTSARDRVLKQFVVWNNGTNQRGFPEECKDGRYGMILPQVVTMGTVTRRAVESTWLAASNAKKNRLGSELKAMVRAPPGYAIVGADVDSEELWICCVMGDAQFGVHGATAIGWMTLEGTKAAGTDLHSKTASILGITRDMAKVFNYSRIYGAGVKHAVQLLLQSNPSLTKHDATASAKALYAATKGLKEHSIREPFKRKYWYGGTESHVFNTLEAVAMAPDPRTPALGCGITAALAKDNLPETEKSKKGEDYMPSRINWVVQSSGVDYLHLLMVSMEYLTKKFEIDARFMISVHDEIRYLVKEEDKYRAALALQISNLWTRALFSHRLQMESLPQSCAWFSAVDIDHVLRKEVNMDCVTPSQPDPIPHGISQDILETLKSTHNGSLSKDGVSPSEEEVDAMPIELQASTETPTAIKYRSTNMAFLKAQNVDSQIALDRLLAGPEWEDAYHLEQQDNLAVPPLSKPTSKKIPRKAATKASLSSESAKRASAKAETVIRSEEGQQTLAQPNVPSTSDAADKRPQRAVLQTGQGTAPRRQTMPISERKRETTSEKATSRHSGRVTALPLRRAPESRSWT